MLVKWQLHVNCSHKTTYDSPTSSPYNATTTASTNTFNLSDPNEALSRHQRERKPVILYREPIPSYLIHKLN